MKKCLCCLLMMAMLVSGFAVTFAEESTVKGTTLFPCDENGYPDLGGVTLTIWIPITPETAEYFDSDADLMVIQKLEELLNVNLEFIHPPVGSEQEGFSTMIASGNYPDMIFNSFVYDYYPGSTTMAYEDGLIWDYTELVNEETTPHFWAKVMSDPYIAKCAVDDEGRIVGLGSRVCGSEESCTNMWGLAIRKDLLEAVNLDVPETIDDWTELLRAFKEYGVEYPLLLNKEDYSRKRNAFSCAWNIDARSFFIREDGTVDYGPATEEYKEFLETLHLWYSEGLINPDFTTDTTDDTVAMLANEEGGAMVDHLNRFGDYYTAVELEHPERALVAAQMPKLSEDAPLTRVMTTNRRLNAHKNICATSEHKEACVAFLDALYDEDIEFMMSNGIEGLAYFINDLGYPESIPYDEDTTVEQRSACSMYYFETDSDSDLDYILTSKYNWGVQPECIKLYVQCSYEGCWPAACSFTSEESEVLAEHRTEIETYRDEMYVKFITGVADIETEYDTYLETLDSLGLPEMREVYEASYARYLAR